MLRLFWCLFYCWLTTFSLTASAENTKVKTFSCPSPAALIDNVKRIRVHAVDASEISSDRPYSGSFLIKRIRLERHDGLVISIDFGGEVVFLAESKSKHEACESFFFHMAGQWTFLDYSWGTGNPYPAQEVKVSDLRKIRWVPLQSLGGSFSQFYYADFRQECVRLILDDEREQGCFKDDIYFAKNRTMQFVSNKNSKFYRFLCHNELAGSKVGELDEYVGKFPQSRENIPTHVRADAALFCTVAFKGYQAQKLALP